MTPPLGSHLSIEEVDDFHENRATARTTSHIETCPQCRSLLTSDARLIAALAALPTWDPSADFSIRLMKRLSPHEAGAAAAALAVPAGHSLRERSARRRVLIGGTVVGTLVTASFGWAVVNPDLALGLAEPAWLDLTGSLWVAVQAISANTVEQPWFGALRDAVATPARALPLIAAAAGVYTVALLGLRRLLTRPAIDAGW